MTICEQSTCELQGSDHVPMLRTQEMAILINQQVDAISKSGNSSLTPQGISDGLISGSIQPLDKFGKNISGQEIERDGKRYLSIGEILISLEEKEFEIVIRF